MVAVAACGLLLPVQPLLAAKPVSPYNPELEQEARRICIRSFAEGVFHHESLDCFPRLRQEMEEALCSVDLGEVWLPFAGGFGWGAGHGRDLGQPYYRSLPFVRFGVDPTAWADWRARHCSDTEPATSLEAPWDLGELPKGRYDRCAHYRMVERTQEVFAAARAAAPRSLTETWERCLVFEQGCDAQKPDVECRLIGTSGRADETVYFTARRMGAPTDAPLLPIPLPRFFPPKLHSDLEIVGAQCEGPEWRKGRRIRGQHTLRCRRLGPGPVTFRLTTSKGECTETLPALGDPPWREACSELDPTIPRRLVLPFLTGPAVSGR